MSILPFPDRIVNPGASATALQTLRAGRLSTACTLCGRRLTYSDSVEVSYGQTCARRYALPYGLGGGALVNRLIDDVAQARLDGDLATVLRLAADIDHLGYPAVAAQIRERLGPPIQIRRLPDGMLLVRLTTRFPAPQFEAWVTACRCWGLRWDRDRGGRRVAASRWAEVMAALAEAFTGELALGPDGELFGVGMEETESLEGP